MIAQNFEQISVANSGNIQNILDLVSARVGSSVNPAEYLVTTNTWIDSKAGDTSCDAEYQDTDLLVQSMQEGCNAFAGLALMQLSPTDIAMNEIAWAFCLFFKDNLDFDVKKGGEKQYKAVAEMLNDYMNDQASQAELSEMFSEFLNWNWG